MPDPIPAPFSTSGPAVEPERPDPAPPPFVFKLGHADVVDYHLARQLLYRLEFRCRREGDELLIFAPGERFFGLYAKPDECPSGAEVARLFVDEGSFSDTLRSDMTVGYNEPWTELVDMTSLLAALASHFEPTFPVEPSPYIGRGRSRQHYLVQHVKALVEGDQSKHPRVQFVR